MKKVMLVVYVLCVIVVVSSLTSAAINWSPWETLLLKKEYYKRYDDISYNAIKLCRNTISKIKEIILRNNIYDQYQFNHQKKSIVSLITEVPVREINAADRCHYEKMYFETSS